MPRCWRSCAPVAGLGSGVVVHTAFQGSPWATHTERPGMGAVGMRAGHGGVMGHGWGCAAETGRPLGGAGRAPEPGRAASRARRKARSQGVGAFAPSERSPPLVGVHWESPGTGRPAEQRSGAEQAGKHDQNARSTNDVSVQDTKRWLERKLPEGVDERSDDGLDGDRRSTE